MEQWVKTKMLKPNIPLFVTLLLFEKDNFDLLKRFTRNPPAPPLQRGVGGDFSDGYPNRYGFDMIFKRLN
jgi:hypothetical protein